LYGECEGGVCSINGEGVKEAILRKKEKKAAFRKKNAQKICKCAFFFVSLRC